MFYSIWLHAPRQAGRDEDMASLMAGIAEVQEVQASGSAQQRCALDFLLFRDIVQDHTAELQQAVLTACLLPTAAVLTAYCGCAYSGYTYHGCAYWGCAHRGCL